MSLLTMNSSNRVRLTLGNRKVEVWISNNQECCEVFGIWLYIGDTVINYTSKKGQEILAEFLEQNKESSFSFVTSSDTKERDDFEFEGSETLKLFNDEVSLEFRVYNQHNGYYQHEFHFMIDDEVVKEGKL